MNEKKADLAYKGHWYSMITIAVGTSLLSIFMYWSIAKRHVPPWFILLMTPFFVLGALFIYAHGCVMMKKQLGMQEETHEEGTKRFYTVLSWSIGGMLFAISSLVINDGLSLIIGIPILTGLSIALVFCLYKYNQIEVE